MIREVVINEYRKFLNRYSLTEGEAVLGAGAACVIHGIRDKTNDLDVEIPVKEFQRLKFTGLPFTKGKPPYSDKLAPDDRTDIHPTDGTVEVTIIDGVAVYSLNALLKQKQSLNRPKDQADIAAILSLMESGK